MFRGMVSGMSRGRMLRNPWLAGRFRQARQFSRTSVKHDFVTPFLFGTWVLPPWQMLYVGGQWFVGHAYPVLPWILIQFLVGFIYLYGARLADYDRGYMLNANMVYSHYDSFTPAMAYIELRKWRNILDTWLSVTPDELRENPDPHWTIAEDGSAEPAADTVSPGGLAAYHLMSGMSLRWEMMVYIGDWNDSWCHRAHLLLIQPTWIIGGTGTVHEKERSYVGDWTDEHFPYSRSITHPLQCPLGVDV